MKLDAYLQYLEFEKRFSPHTLIAYRSDLGQLSEFLVCTFDIHKPQDITGLHLRSWMVDLLSRDCASRSVHRKISAVKSWFRFLRKRGEVAHSPATQLVMPKSGKRLPVVLEQNDLDTLFHRVEFGEDFAGQRDKTALELLYQAGLRRSELIGLMLSDIDWTQRYLRVFGKGRKERLIPFGKALEDSLRRYLLSRTQAFPRSDCAHLLLNNGGQVMTDKQVYHLVRHWLSAVTTMEQRSPHVLRHSFATHLSDNGADLNAIKALLGHSSLAATQVYMHNSIERLRQVYLQAHPKAKKQDT